MVSGDTEQYSSEELISCYKQAAAFLCGATLMLAGAASLTYASVSLAKQAEYPVALFGIVAASTLLSYPIAEIFQESTRRSFRTVAHEGAEKAKSAWARFRALLPALAIIPATVAALI